MRNQFWIFNISLVLMFILAIMINILLKQTYIPIRERVAEKTYARQGQLKTTQLKIEKIYENDLFDTYSAKTGHEIAKTKLPPLPNPKPPKVYSIPTPPAIELIPPLNVTLKGIMFSLENSKSVVLIEDETSKEKSYKLGDRVKDAQIIKIARDRAVILRTNGQQETLLLRKDDNTFLLSKDAWAKTIKKKDDSNYEIDLENFKKQVPSLGTLFEALSLINAYKNNNVMGIKIGQLKDGEVGAQLGLKNGDVIEEVQGIKAVNVEDRTNIINILKSIKYGDLINVKIIRDNNEITVNYKITKIKPAMIPPFATSQAIPDEKVLKSGLFELSPEQKKMQQQREFYKMHPKKEREETISEMRKQILENMKRREQNARILE